MKPFGRPLLLRILATTAIGSSVYAGAVTLRTSLFGMNGGLFALLLFVMTMLIGHLAGWQLLGKTPEFASYMAVSKFARFFSFMLHIKDGAHVIMNAAAWSTVLLPLLAVLLIYRSYGIWRIIFEMLLAMVAYIMSLKHSRLASAQIMQKAAVYFSFIVLAVCLEAPYFLKNLAYLRPWLFAASYFFILAFLIIKNQEDIDSNIFDKKHVEKSILPRNLRRFNTVSVCVVFLVIILFFNLKEVVKYILFLLGRLTILIIKGVLWILSCIMPSSQGDLQQGEAAPNAFDFFGESAELVYPFKNLISNTIKYFIILYVTYRLLVILKRKIPGLVRRIVGWLQKILSIKKGQKSFETMDYNDETETIKPTRKHDNKREVKKKMRKSRLNLRSISDPAERVRQMYSTILQMLPLLGVRLYKCDTTMEIAGKTAASGEVVTASREVAKEFLPFTAIYNQVRYGDTVPDSGMLKEAEVHFEKAVEVIERKYYNRF